LAKGRRWALLMIVTIGAVVTPSGDPLTLLLLSAPLYVLYEATIWLVRFLIRR
jgi:sec-independent protein translocase protein TatC